VSALGQLNQRSYRDQLDLPLGQEDLGDLQTGPESFLRPPRRFRRRGGAPGEIAQVRAALDDVFDEVQELCQWGWPSCWAEDHERHACQTVVDAAAHLLRHDEPAPADLLAIIQPILDAYWPARRWTLHRAHEAVERLRVVVAFVRYGNDPALVDRPTLRYAA
jgi:hypothetical protein